MQIHRRFAVLSILVCLPFGSLLAISEPVVVLRCDRAFTFGFGEWQDAPTRFRVGSPGIHLQHPNGRGGAGIGGLQVPLQDFTDWTPALRMQTGQGNRASTLFVVISDADGTTHRYRYDLTRAQPGVPTTLIADYATAVAEPYEVEKAGERAGLSDIAVWMVVGDWSNEPVDVTLIQMELLPASDAFRAQREEWRRILAEREAQAQREREARMQAVKRLIEQGSPHPPDGPEVTHVCTVAPDVLVITVQAGKYGRNELVPYQPQSGDEIVEEEKDKPRYRVENGRVVTYYTRVLYRQLQGTRTRVGLISPDGRYLFMEGRSTGTPLDETAVDYPEAYRIQSRDDARYHEPLSPLAVYRKSKPNAPSRPLPYQHTLSLKLPHALREGCTYTIFLHGINTAQKKVTYVHRPRQTVSLAVHAIQTGYRPDDPFKRAYYSFWMGVDRDGKQCSVVHTVERFELLDKNGKTVYLGQARLTKQEGHEEQISIHERGDYARSAVYRLDFSEFATPGEYRVYVPGVGVSYPFRIARDVWDEPFLAAMHAIFTQRQGIELGPPMTGFRRPRSFHPDDGVEFYQLDIPWQAGQEGVRGQRMLELTRDGKPLERVTGIWGGYQDAGDWDTMGHHLSATYDLLCLYDLNPRAFERYRLKHLPREEQTNNLPDILDEALWQMALWKRLQREDGAVRGGYGDGWGCYPGETSWMIKYAGVYDVDHETTYHFAACSARAFRVLSKYDRRQAQEYLRAALRAWQWAEAHNRPDDPAYQKVLRYDASFPQKVRHLRALAAAELLAATRDVRYDSAFKECTELHEERWNHYMDQPAANFAYARLPEGVGDTDLKRRARERILAYAEHAIAFSRNNAFDVITAQRTDLPLIGPCTYFSTPGGGGMALIYAYELSRDPKYLAASVQGSNFCLGANPMNLSYCTGVGKQYQRFTFIVDALVTGQQPDIIRGHIPYGQGNEANSMSRGANEWVHTWFLNFGNTRMRPVWYDWPVYEQYIDFAIYPMNNENCFNQTMVKAACYWFYLANRPDLQKRSPLR